MACFFPKLLWLLLFHHPHHHIPSISILCCRFAMADGQHLRRFLGGNPQSVRGPVLAICFESQLLEEGIRRASFNLGSTLLPARGKLFSC